jgi:hypothetical protein
MSRLRGLSLELMSVAKAKRRRKLNEWQLLFQLSGVERLNVGVPSRAGHAAD